MEGQRDSSCTWIGPVASRSVKERREGRPFEDWVG